MQQPWTDISVRTTSPNCSFHSSPQRPQVLTIYKYVEYFGLHGNQDYDVKTTAKLALAKAEGINILPIYPTDMINLDEVLKDLVDMPKEQENQIECR